MPPAPVLEHVNNGAVDHLSPGAPGATNRQGLEETLKNFSIAPARIQRQTRVPLAELFEQIAPPRAGSGDPQNAFERPPVVHGWAAGAPTLGRQERHEQCPRVVGE
jgi:hypothetical protein